MIINKLAIPRRTVLRGLGAAIALPFLDSMVPALTTVAKTAARGTPRLSIIYTGNGAALGHFAPSAEGAAYEMTPILQPLAPFRDRMLVLTGIDNSVAMAREGEPRGGHGRVAPAFLTGVHARPTIGADFQAGTSLDQIAARHLGRETQLASLELAVDAPEFGGTCDTGFSCVYTNTISWRTPTEPLPMENNPRILFERMFGDSGSTNPAVRVARLRERASVLDAITDRASSLRASVGSADRTKLDAYLESIREIERGIEKAEEQSARELPLLEQPAGVPDTFEAHVKMLFDLQVLAFQADLTRIQTFMLARELSGRAYREVGVSEGFHAISHHGNNPEKITGMGKINVYHSTLVAYYLEKLATVQDGDGSLLDQAMVFFGSGMGNSNEHDPHELPLILAGGAAGAMPSGRHIRYKKGSELPNLYVTMLNKLGVPETAVGESTGALSIS
jgi:Protein of unknown function (DUF1552)